MTLHFITLPLLKRIFSMTIFLQYLFSIKSVILIHFFIWIFCHCQITMIFLISSKIRSKKYHLEEQILNFPRKRRPQYSHDPVFRQTPPSLIFYPIAFRKKNTQNHYMFYTFKMRIKCRSDGIRNVSIHLTV